MLYYLTAAGLVAHTYFWGAGLAGSVLPREWRRWWWVFAPGLGLALQSAVVWAGAHTPLAGTAAYARWSELLPLALLLWVTKQQARWNWWNTGLAPRTAAAWAAVVLVAGWMLVQPMAQPGPGLTASSLGSCDHADYAAGARVLQEFAKDDRTGFLGLSEVTHVRSAEYFFDFWLRLNHFTPSALLAHNAAVFGVESYRLISVTAAALVLLNLPMTLFLARCAMGVRAGWLVGLVMVYAFSPLNAYAVHHGALGQLYAAQGIALLTVAIFGARRTAQMGRNPWLFLPLMFASLWLLAGSYNFILLVCLAPSAAWLAALAWHQRTWQASTRVLGVVIMSLGLCAAFFWGRFDGLIERFSLFEQYNFGWAVPIFSPEGWWGILRDTGLHAWPGAVRVILSVAVIGLWSCGLIALWRRKKELALASLALVGPVIIGWGILVWESRLRANASYDAFKIFSVFYPGLLAGLCCWATVAAPAKPWARRGAATILTFLVTSNLAIAFQFHRTMAHPPLRADHMLAELSQLETEPRVKSLNMLIEDYWSRLWANSFLLRKPQYFVTHTYEGRLNTALKGEWNLSDNLLRAIPLNPDDRIIVNTQFHAERISAPGLVTARFDSGWYDNEHGEGRRWRWSDGMGNIVLTNPSKVSLHAALSLEMRGVSPRPMEIRLDQKVVSTCALDGTYQDILINDFIVPPGRSMLSFVCAAEAGPSPTDSRQLAVALFAFELRARSISPQ